MPDGRPPDLPPDAPLDLREFIECKRDSVTIKQGELTWLPLPPEIKEYAPNPTLGLEPGASPGTGTMTLSVGFATLTIPVSISDGELHMDTSGVSAIPGAQEAIDTWLKDFNDWLKKNGKRLKPTSIKDGSVTLTKEPIVAVPATPPPPAPPGPPVKPVTPVPPASGGGIGGGCALFGLLGVVLVGLIGAAWFTGLIPGSGGSGAQPSTTASTGTVAKPSTSTAPIAKPSTSTGPIAKPSTSTGPAKAPPPAAAQAALDLLKQTSVLTDDQIALLEWYADQANDMYFPTPGQTPTQYFPESDLSWASAFRASLDTPMTQQLSGWTCAQVHQLADGTPFRTACNQDKSLIAGDYVIFVTTHAGGYPATFPSAGNHSWSVYTNPDNDPTTGFQSTLRDNYLIGADSYFEMLAFTEPDGDFRNYMLATRMADPVRADTGQKQGNLPTTGRVFWFDDIGTQLWMIPQDDFGGTNWYAGNFATLNRGANSPANLAADALHGPDDIGKWLDYFRLQELNKP